MDLSRHKCPPSFWVAMVAEDTAPVGDIVMSLSDKAIYFYLESEYREYSYDIEVAYAGDSVGAAESAVAQYHHDTCSRRIFQRVIVFSVADVKEGEGNESATLDLLPEGKYEVFDVELTETRGYDTSAEKVEL